jgi:hypothetical protein
MPKPTMLKLVRKEDEEQGEDRGTKSPVLRGPRPGLLLLLRRLGRTSRGYALAGAGVVVGAVVVVSLLSWLAPDSDRPMGHPLEAVGRVAGGVLEQVDDQVEALLGTDGETVLQDVRENLAAVSSRISWSGRGSEVTPDRSSASSGPSTPASTTRSTLDTPAQEDPSSSVPNEPPPTTYAPSPSSTNPPSSTSETPPFADPQPPVTDEPTTPPTATEEPPTPPTEEPLPPPVEPPPAEQPSTPSAEEPPAGEPPAEEPPVEEVPPPTGPPPVTGEPAPPTAEEPPPTADQSPRPPTGLI